jgi:hypothetical protein
LHPRARAVVIYLAVVLVASPANIQRSSPSTKPGQLQDVVDVRRQVTARDGQRSRAAASSIQGWDASWPPPRASDPVVLLEHEAVGAHRFPLGTAAVDNAPEAD